MHKAINQFLPSPLVVKLHLLPVPWMNGKGAIDLELPGTTENCMRIQEIPDQVLAMLEAEKNKNYKTAISKPAPRTRKARKPVTINLAPVSRRDHPKYTPPSVTVQARKSDILKEETSDSGKCKNLKELWSPSYHQISNRKYWLGKVFTLDENNDDVIDNVGFLMYSDDRPDIYIGADPDNSILGLSWDLCARADLATTNKIA